MNSDVYWIASPVDAAILQGELLFNVVEFRVKPETIGADLEVDEVVHPLALVVTQDCDLDLDHKARAQAGAAHRLVDNILVCDVDDGLAMRNRGELNHRAWALVETYQNERYHVLPGFFGGVLGIDFRRFFTMPTPELYHRVAIGEAVRCCYLSPTCRDHFSNRFYGYHMRVALEAAQE